jgi:alpha-D-xyloside xylohydrolase
VSYGYEKGEFSRITIGYVESIGGVVIGARSGSYPGMPEQRTFKVRLIKDGAKPADLDAKPDFKISYMGEAIAAK